MDQAGHHRIGVAVPASIRTSKCSSASPTFTGALSKAIRGWPDPYQYAKDDNGRQGDRPFPDGPEALEAFVALKRRFTGPYAATL